MSSTDHDRRDIQHAGTKQALAYWTIQRHQIDASRIREEICELGKKVEEKQATLTSITNKISEIEKELKMDIPKINYARKQCRLIAELLQKAFRESRNMSSSSSINKST